MFKITNLNKEFKLKKISLNVIKYTSLTSG